MIVPAQAMSESNGRISGRHLARTLTRAGAAVVAPMIVPSSVLGRRAGVVPPSDKIMFGGIGIGSRGMSSVA